MSIGTDNNTFINILIAEDNEVSRELMVAILKTQNYNVLTASDGDAAIEIVRKHSIDLALVDINMAPKGGFEFVKYLIIRSIQLPVIIVTGDESSDILMEANALGVKRVLQKPVDPDRLLQTIGRILQRSGASTKPFATSTHETRHSDQELMAYTIQLAEKNFLSGKGGPFGAVIADAEGRILGEGVNGITSRADPTAHAEVLAIRQAAEKLGKTDLSDCILYISSQPTMMGQALIISVGIKTVYYGLTHEDVRSIRQADIRVREELSKQEPQRQTEYRQLGREEAAAMFQRWQTQKVKIAD
jgi:guanine deaminase